MREELVGKIMKEFVALRPNMYSYIIDNGCIEKVHKEMSYQKINQI